MTFVNDEEGIIRMTADVRWPNATTLDFGCKCICENELFFCYRDEDTQEEYLLGTMTLERYSDGNIFANDVTTRVWNVGGIVWNGVRYDSESGELIIPAGDTLTVYAEEEGAEYDSIVFVRDEGLVSFYDRRNNAHWRVADQTQ